MKDKLKYFAISTGIMAGFGGLIWLVCTFKFFTFAYFTLAVIALWILIYKIVKEKFENK